MYCFNYLIKQRLGPEDLGDLTTPRVAYQPGYLGIRGGMPYLGCATDFQDKANVFLR